MQPATGVSWVKNHLDNISLSDLFNVRLVGFSGILAWYFIVFFSKTIHYSIRNEITSHFNSVFGWSCAGIVTIMMVSILAPASLRYISSHPILRHSATLFMCAATITLVCVENYIFTQPWCSISAAIAGAGFAMALLAWAMHFNTLTIETAITSAAASLILSALIFGITTSIPLTAAIVITVLLPLISDAILTIRCKVWLHDDSGANASLTHLFQYKYPLICFLGISIVSSFVQILFLQPDTIINQEAYSWFLLIAALIGTAIVGTTLFSQSTLAYGTTLKILAYSLSFIFLLLPIFDLGNAITSIFALTIFCLVVSFMWPLVLRVCEQLNVSIRLMVGVGLLAQTTGALIGTFGGALLTEHVTLTPRLLSAIALPSVVLVMLCTYLLLADRNFAKLTGSKEAGVPAKLTFKERVAIIADDYGLTPRESEILELVVKGRSKPRIQEMTGLTAGTVNTHLSRIYKKLDLHDKQEILDLVEQAG